MRWDFWKVRNTKSILMILVLILLIGNVSAASINLLTTNQANGGESGATTGFYADWGNADLTADTTEHWQGSYSIKTITHNIENSEGVDLDCSVSPSTQYTFSVYLKGTGTGNIAIAEQTSSGVWIDWTQSSAITLNGTWTRYNVTRTFGATGRIAHLYAFVTSSKQLATVYSDGLQLEVSATNSTWEEPVYLYTYPMSFINETRILPNSDTNLPAEGSNLSIIAVSDQYEASSFIIKPSVGVSDVTITATNLSDGSGHTIPAGSIDIKTIKVWYQADDDSIGSVPTGYFLTPELLLNNDSIVRVNITEQTNELWNFNTSSYYHIDNTTIGTFPDDFLLYDNKTVEGFPQPFALSRDENKQIWVTTHIPSGQESGNYTGTVWVNSSSTNPAAINFTVWVLPFTLSTSTLEYGLYYRGFLSAVDPIILSSEEKTSAQQLAELLDMKNHGVLYPTSYQQDDAKLETALTLRDTAGLPTDKFYALGLTTGNSTDPATLATLSNDVTAYIVHTAAHGYTDTYFYGIDEAIGSTLLSERTAWETVHSAGGKVFVAGGTNIYDLVGDLLDTVVYAQTLKSAEPAKWHSQGNKIFVYSNPQVGLENPEIYRQNYGVGLWWSDYDGAMNYAYQHRAGQSIWNDYDDSTTNYREHIFAYPKTDGVIDTIQWEGWREGVDDTRYADKLTTIRGDETWSLAIINNGITEGWDMSIIRNKLIDAILNGGPVPPTADFSADHTTGQYPLTVQFVDQSQDSPTSWNWLIISPNILSHSEDFEDAVWGDNSTQVVVYPDTTTAPDGTITGDRATTVGGSKGVNRYNYLDAGTYTFTFYVKAGDSDSCSFGIYQGGWVAGQAGKILSGPGTISNVYYSTVSGLSTTEWTRVSTTATVTSDLFITFIYPSSLGDAKYNYLWGAQLSEGEEAITYVKTGSAPISNTYLSTSQHPSYTFNTGTHDIRLIANNSEGSSTKTKYGYITVHDPDAANPETGINSIIAALTLFSIMLIGAGCMGIIYTLGSVGGYVGEQSNNGLIMISSIGAIAIGAVLLILTYAIVSPIATVVGV